MISTIDFHIPELEQMQSYPKEIFYKGNTNLLKYKKISIVGSRRPISYVKTKTTDIAKALSKAGICIVSGGAMGVDALSHKAAGEDNTIMVAGTGLDIRYPAINKKLIATIEQKGLVLSQFDASLPSLKQNFPARNELVVALGDALIVTQADLKSGTMHSVNFALSMQKPIYVLPHRLGESEGTNKLIKEGLATPIYDIDAFVANFGEVQECIEDAFLEFCKQNPSYDEAVSQYASEVFEYELMGKISIENGVITLA